MTGEYPYQTRMTCHLDCHKVLQFVSAVDALFVCAWQAHLRFPVHAPWQFVWHFVWVRLARWPMFVHMIVHPLHVFLFIFDYVVAQIFFPRVIIPSW